jgi:hypothetical protein
MLKPFSSSPLALKYSLPSVMTPSTSKAASLTWLAMERISAADFKVSAPAEWLGVF